MKPFNSLTPQENEELLKFPAYISILAAFSNNELDEAEKNAAMKFAHTKTFSCDPLLSKFYDEAEKVFEKNIERLDKDLPRDKDHRTVAIKEALSKLGKILSKLDKKYTPIMYHSMHSFKEHVSRAHDNVLVDFVLPMRIPGLTV
jgi:hypothetical protein